MMDRHGGWQLTKVAGLVGSRSNGRATIPGISGGGSGRAGYGHGVDTGYWGEH